MTQSVLACLQFQGVRDLRAVAPSGIAGTGVLAAQATMSSSRSEPSV